MIDGFDANNKSTEDIALPLTEGNDFNARIWEIARVPLGNDQYWFYRDRNAQTEFRNNELRLKIIPFSSSNDQVQIFDNPKHLYLTQTSFSTGSQGRILFSCQMAADMVDGNPDDYRDGFASFNVLDFGTGMVFDIISSGKKYWAIYERLYMPGITTEKEAFTTVIPIESMDSGKDPLDCAIEYDQKADTVRYYLNSHLVYEATEIPVKVRALQTGFGIITLHPIQDGRSVSCHGQGGWGVWSNFKVSRI